MTQPPTTPGPDEPAGEARPAAPAGEPQPLSPAEPPLRPAAPGDFVAPPPPAFGAPPPMGTASGDFVPPPPAGTASGDFGAPPPVGSAPAAQAQYDPTQSYVVYQAAPEGGYGVPILTRQAGYDPMISPDYSGWWQRSFAIVKGAWKQLLALQLIGFLLSLVVVIPEGLYSTVLAAGFTRDTQAANPGDVADLTPLLSMLGLIVAALVVASLISCLISVAGNQIAVSVAAGLPPRLGPALALAARRFLALWSWQLLAALIMVAGFCACFLPFIYLYAVFLVLPAVVTFERGSGAIARCFQLFHRDLGSAVARVASIAGVAFLVGVVAYVIGQIIQTLAGGAQLAGAGAVPAADGRVLATAAAGAVIASSVVSGLLEAGAKMFTDVLTVTAYADMRARLEPLSTATLAAEAGLAPAAQSEWVAPPMPPLA